MSTAKRKEEDSADGCRGLAQDGRARAATMTSVHMRAVLERSADAWSAGTFAPTPRQRLQ